MSWELKRKQQDAVLQEANRVMGICNACRYCEGICALFPAMEMRRTFTAGDLNYLANLCHNCRGCYYCCQYAPPHEFQLNFPQAMSALRAQTYEQTAPGFLKKLFPNNAFYVFAVSLLATVLLTAFALCAKGASVFFASHTGPGSFYQIIPYGAMLLIFCLAALFTVVALIRGVIAFWKISDGKLQWLDLAAHKQAIRDVLTLKYLDGGGDGCNYPDNQFSMIRRKFHHATFYGFLLCLASTTVAFIMDHGFGWPAPYGFFSLPVLLGTAGGLGLVVGTGGMLWLKTVMDARPADPASIGMDMAFSTLLFLVSLSGLLLLVLRSTELMGLLLCVHLGLVLGLFLTMPCGKFVHVVFRYAALVRNAHEQRTGQV
ncbi:MAG: tricarballylate utilization 4Fe-4S protein TcuB [Desulfovibrio sp.]|jgi:citrate/tricarballylate utilization protein|nr:tricarballylate utilization 4Fe-4S protein TcuB [Desulfovibrio sp.]